MGLFDKLLNNQGTEYVSLDKREAFTGVLLAVVAADGDVSSEEAEEIVAVSNRMRLYKDQPADRFNTMINKLVGLLNKRGVDQLLDKSIEALPEELRPTAFAVAADLIFADGAVEAAEHKVLERLQTRLMIDEKLATQIVEVMMIKNRG